MKSADPRPVRLAVRVYGRVMRWLSRETPSEQAEMGRTFRQLCLREAKRSGWRAVAWRTVEELVDLARSSRQRGGPHRPRERGRAWAAAMQTVSHALRSVRRRPGYAVAFIVTMGAGIGINAAMLPVVGAAALRPLPYRAVERLSEIWTYEPSTQRDGPGVAAEDFVVWREHTDVFETFEGFGPEAPKVLTGFDEPRQIQVSRVTTGLFAQLGVAPVLGRSFASREGLPGGPPVIVLGHGLWASTFGGDANVLGRTVRLDDVDHVVIGVMPPEFAFPYGRAEAWLPVAPTPAGLEAAGSLIGLAHVRAGLTREAAQERLTARLRAERGEVAPEREPLVNDISFMTTPEATRRSLILLLGAVLFVLLIATANVLSLGVAEASRRHRELAVMATLGAGRRRLLAQLMAEAGVLCGAGAALGLLLAWVALSSLVPLIPERLNLMTGGRTIGLWPDGVGLAIVAVVAAAPLVGSLTALLARVGGTGVLARGATGPDRASGRIQHGLVSVQVALSLVLLAGAGLLLDSFARLVTVDPGVAAEQVLLVGVQLPRSRYAESGQRSVAVRSMSEALAGLPGVRSVTATSSVLPMSRARFRPELEAEGGEMGALDGFLPFHQVDGRFFETLGIEVLRGRALEDGDAGRDVAVVNDVLARRLWPDGRALDRRFRVAPDAPWLTVVGVSEDVPQMGLRDPWGEGMEFYVPTAQEAGSGWTFALRTGGEPLALSDAVRRAIWSVDARQPIERITTYRAALGEDMGRERFYAVLLSAFAALATLLAAVGIHAVVSQVVHNRTREIGIRAALGAGRLRIVRAATGSGAVAVGIGLVVGLVATLALTRFLESILFGVEPRDPGILAVNVAVLLGVAGIAALVPVRRALGVEPVRAMRVE